MNNISKILDVRWIEQSCLTCRYYREHETSAITMNCLLLGKLIGISSNSVGCLDSVKGLLLRKICDGWKKRPKVWNIKSKGIKNNPFWDDPYISRGTQQRLRNRILKRGNKK